MSRIVIGSNTFGKYHRQDVAVDSWKHLQQKYDIDIYDIQFKDEVRSFDNVYNLNVIPKLTRSSESILKKSSKKLPLVNDVISCLSEVDCEYFIFTNSDVIINSNLIEYINNSKPTAFGCSRLDIHNVNGFEDILRKNVTPVRYEIAGFDTFIFKKDWYVNHYSLFRDYFLGKPVWDQVYTTLLKIYADNDPFGNQFPPYCFHIHHGISSVTTECPEQQFNIKNKDGSYIDSLMCKIFDNYLQSIAIHRQPYGAFLHVEQDEQKHESVFFEKLKCSR